MIEAHIKPETIKVRLLVDEYRSGRIVIPEFQRDYVWKKSKAPYLIDSIYRGFPISSLLLWESSEQARSRRNDPRPARGGSVSWLIDGQQRVITLSRLINGDEGIDVVFNPDSDEFKLANAATRNDRNWFRVADLLDEQLYRDLRRNLDGDRRSDRREERFERVRRVLDYEIPMVRMVNHTFEDAVLAFTRINTLGVKLKKQDIESAQVAARHSGFIADEVAPFLDDLKRQGFTRLNVMHLFRACAFVATPDGRSRTPLHELDGKEVLAAWKETQRGTDQALALIRSELGLINMDILWSGALLVPLIALCATVSPKKRDARGMIGWLALATLLHRFSGSSESALEQDLKACRSDDPIGALLANLRQGRSVLAARPSDFEGALNDRSGLLAAYIACAHRGILDFYTGGKLTMSKSIDRHHILPRGQFDEQSRKKADTVANIAFISGDVNKSISSRGPEVYLKDIGKNVLESQCIPLDEPSWRVDKSDEFWKSRRNLLADAFNGFIRASLPQRKAG